MRDDMSDEKRTLDNAWIAIDTITEKLLNIAVLENKYLNKIKAIEKIEKECNKKLNEVETIIKLSGIRRKEMITTNVLKYKWMKWLFYKKGSFI
jgi:hypothetical protein